MLLRDYFTILEFKDAWDSSRISAIHKKKTLRLLLYVLLFLFIWFIRWSFSRCFANTKFTVEHGRSLLDFLADMQSGTGITQPWSTCHPSRSEARKYVAQLWGRHQIMWFWKCNYSTVIICFIFFFTQFSKSTRINKSLTNQIKKIMINGFKRSSFLSESFELLYLDNILILVGRPLSEDYSKKKWPSTLLRCIVHPRWLIRGITSLLQLPPISGHWAVYSTCFAIRLIFI